MAKDPDSFSDKEAKARFEAALKGAMNTPHKPLKEKPKVKKAEEESKDGRLTKCQMMTQPARLHWNF